MKCRRVSVFLKNCNDLKKVALHGSNIFVDSVRGSYNITKKGHVTSGRQRCIKFVLDLIIWVKDTMISNISSLYTKIIKTCRQLISFCLVLKITTSSYP